MDSGRRLGLVEPGFMAAEQRGASEDPTARTGMSSTDLGWHVRPHYVRTNLALRQVETLTVVALVFLGPVSMHALYVSLEHRPRHAHPLTVGTRLLCHAFIFFIVFLQIMFTQRDPVLTLHETYSTVRVMVVCQ